MDILILLLCLVIIKLFVYPDILVFLTLAYAGLFSLPIYTYYILAILVFSYSYVIISNDLEKSTGKRLGTHIYSFISKFFKAPIIIKKSCKFCKKNKKKKNKLPKWKLIKIKNFKKLL